jgi:transcriptional antiterminator RfaH
VGVHAVGFAMMRWYVVNTLPHQELRALANLHRQGFAAWLPAFRKGRRHARRVDSVVTPLFPGYLFMHLDVATARWRSINGTFGVIKLLCHGELPAPVPTGLVDELLAKRDSEGLVRLPLRQFARGEAVRVAEGPFADLVGIYEGMSGRDRVVLLLSLLGREVKATVPMAGLAA